MLPVLTVIALEFAFLMGGLVVTEQVFNLNGLGLLFVEAVAHRDYTLTQALVLLVADRKSTRLNSSHLGISYAVFCLKKKRQCTNASNFSCESQSSLTQIARPALNDT